jgi:hypothetical protein
MHRDLTHTRVFRTASTTSRVQPRKGARALAFSRARSGKLQSCASHIASFGAMKQSVETGP